MGDPTGKRLVRYQGTEGNFAPTPKNSRLPPMTDIFKQALVDLEEIAKAERRAIRDEAKIDDPQEHRQENRILQRESIIPKNRTCPRCLEKKLDPRQWVIIVNGRSEPQRWRQMLANYRASRIRAISRGNKPPKFDIYAVCKSCTMIEQSEMKGQPFTPVVYVFIDSMLVKRTRYALNLSSQQVADACGWSQAKQSKMESRSDYILELKDAEALQKALDLIAPPTVADPDIRYRVDPNKLKAMRLATGASRRLVASWLGVSTERVRHLEQNFTIVQGRIAKCILKGFVRMTSQDSDDDAVIG